MIRDNFREELKKAMLERNQVRLGVIRMILAMLKDKDIAVRSETSREGIADDQILQMLQTMVKQRQESVVLYKTGERPDLVEKEEKEIEILRTFLPEPISNDELESIVRQAIEEEEASQIKDMGRVMNVLKEKYAGRMDFGVAGQLVKRFLG